MNRTRLGVDMNADYNAVSRTAANTVGSPPQRETPDPVGPVVDEVLCPLCRTSVELMAIGVRVQGRCPGCTVIVRIVGGQVRACGWMGGGDMAKAGAAVSKLRSRWEGSSPALRPGPTCGDRIGTTAGYYRHKAVGEQPCDDCREASRAYARARKAKKAEERRAALKPCGTDAAYRRHLKAGETPCDACREAHTRLVTLAARKRRKRYHNRQAAA